MNKEEFYWTKLPPAALLKWNVRKYIIEYGLIKAYGDVVKCYNPLDFYYPRGSEVSLYIKLINIDENNLNQIISFCNEFGLLYEDLTPKISFMSKYFIEQQKNPNLNVGFPVILFQNEVKTLRTLTQIWAGIMNRNNDIIHKAYMELLKSILKSDDFIGWEAIIPFDYDEIVSKEISISHLNEHPERLLYCCEFCLLNCINDKITAIFPELSLRGKTIQQMWAKKDNAKGDKKNLTFQVQQNWVCQYLLQACYLMFAFDMNAGYFIRYCDCGNYFIPTRTDNFFCSKKCGARVRKRRERSKTK